MTDSLNVADYFPYQSFFGSEGRVSVCDGYILDFVNRDARDDLDPRRSECSISGGDMRFHALVKTSQGRSMNFVLTVFNREMQREEVSIQALFRVNGGHD